MYQSSDENIAAVSLGSNLGDSLAILEGAIATIQERLKPAYIKKSSWYRTKPIGPPQPDYVNGCIAFPYEKEPEALMQHLLDIEQQFGRERSVRWGARTLDLDLLLLGQQINDTEFLRLPHPRIGERAFVLVPLSEIYSTWMHPLNGLSVADMLKDLPIDDIEKI